KQLEETSRQRCSMGMWGRAVATVMLGAWLMGGTGTPGWADTPEPPLAPPLVVDGPVLPCPPPLAPPLVADGPVLPCLPPCPPPPRPPVPLPPPPPPCPPDPPPPVVTVKVRVPACAVLTEELEYRICIENCSPSAAHHVVIRNPLPANARFVRANPQPNETKPELLWRRRPPARGATPTTPG